jgi:hypothetical protein
LDLSRIMTTLKPTSFFSLTDIIICFILITAMTNAQNNNGTLLVKSDSATSLSSLAPEVTHLYTSIAASGMVQALSDSMVQYISTNTVQNPAIHIHSNDTDAAVRLMDSIDAGLQGVNCVYVF